MKHQTQEGSGQKMFADFASDMKISSVVTKAATKPQAKGRITTESFDPATYLASINLSELYTRLDIANYLKTIPKKKMTPLFQEKPYPNMHVTLAIRAIQEELGLPLMDIDQRSQDEFEE